jgi:tetratricopeptide (TPR) repeat protein
MTRSGGLPDAFRPAYLILGLAALGALIYMSAAWSPPLRDDRQDLDLLVAATPAEALAQRSHPDATHPLANVVRYALIRVTGRMNSIRVASALLHGLTAAMLFMLVQGLLTRGRRPEAVSLVAPAACGLIFAVHPICSEAILSHRAFPTILGTALAVGSLLQAIPGRGAGTRQSPFLSVSLYLAALLCEASLWPAALAAAALARIPEAPDLDAPGKSFPRRLAPYTVALGLYYLSWTARSWPGLEFLPTMRSWSFLGGLASQSAAFVTELKLLLVPVGLSLDHAASTYVGTWNLQALIGGVLLLVLFLSALLMRNLATISSLAIVWFASLHIHLLVAPPMDPISERRLYAQMVAIALAVAAGALRAERGLGARAVFAGAAVVSIPLLLVTVDRVRLWEDPVAIWESAARRNSASPMAHLALAHHHLSSDDPDAALRSFEVALARSPRNASIQNSIAEIYFLKGDYQRAAQEADKAMELDPAFLPAYITAGNSFMARNQPRDAFLAFNAALLIDEDNPSALFNMGVLFHQQKRYAKATELLERALEHRPGDPDILFRLGMSRLNSNDITGAIEALKGCLAAGEVRPDAQVTLATLLTQMDEHDEARRLLEEVLESDPGHAQALNGLAVLASTLDDWEKARDLFSRAIEADPSDVRILYNLAGAHEQLGDLDDAERAYRTFIDQWKGPLDMSEDARIRLERLESRQGS